MEPEGSLPYSKANHGPYLEPDESIPLLHPIFMVHFNIRRMLATTQLTLFSLPAFHLKPKD
jgi:hypothetical protein